RAAEWVGGPEHIGPLAANPVQRRQRSTEQDVVRQRIAAIQPELIVPRLVEREVVLIGVLDDALDPAVLLRRTERAAQAPPVGEPLLYGGFQSLRAVGLAVGSVEPRVESKGGASIRRVVIVDRHHPAIVAGPDDAV